MGGFGPQLQPPGFWGTSALRSCQQSGARSLSAPRPRGQALGHGTIYVPRRSFFLGCWSVALPAVSSPCPVFEHVAMVRSLRWDIGLGLNAAARVSVFSTQ